VFEPTLKGPPYEILVEDGDNGSKVVVVEIARRGPRIVAVSCELVQTATGAEICSEFAFSIIVFSVDDSFEPFETQDRNIAAPFIPQVVRPLVMPLVASCLQSLIESARPARVYRVAKEPNPVEKALIRHHFLTNALSGMGYVIEDEGTDPYNRRFCLMRLP
jgi:hypothetical protein